MTAELNPRQFELQGDGLALSGEELGEGPPIVLLHGLTATRWYVVLGSKLLARHGFRVVSYDARAHGESSGALAPEAYEYRDLAADLEAVLADRTDSAPVVLAGSSMGAHTAMALALQFPERVAALVQVTPAYEGRPREGDEADPGHPLAIAREYAKRLPDAELLVEDEGKSPLAWQGAQLSRAIEDFVKRKAPDWASKRTSS